MTKIVGRVIGFLFAASRVSTSRTRVEVVLTAYVGKWIVSFLEALGMNVVIEAEIPVKRTKKQECCVSFVLCSEVYEEQK